MATKNNTDLEELKTLKNWRQTAFVIIAGVVSAFLGWIAKGNKA
jgi:hypothetical protein